MIGKTSKIKIDTTENLPSASLCLSLFGIVVLFCALHGFGVSIFYLLRYSSVYGWGNGDLWWLGVMKLEVGGNGESKGVGGEGRNWVYWGRNAEVKEMKMEGSFVFLPSNEGVIWSFCIAN